MREASTRPSCRDRDTCSRGMAAIRGPERDTAGRMTRNIPWDDAYIPHDSDILTRKYALPWLSSSMAGERGGARLHNHQQATAGEGERDGDETRKAAEPRGCVCVCVCARAPDDGWGHAGARDRELAGEVEVGEARRAQRRPEDGRLQQRVGEPVGVALPMQRAVRTGP